MKGMQSMADIGIERVGDSGNVASITLARPEQRNAMSVYMVSSLLEFFESRESLSADAILLSGEGRGFCAGSDLSALAAMTGEERSRFEADCGRLARLMRTHPRPIVAAVHGFAIGGGLTLAAACDMIVTEPQAKWSLPEVAIGLFPAWGLEGVTLRTGRSIARRLTFGVETLSGKEAKIAGLADMLVDNPINAAHDLTRRLADLPAERIAATKDYFSCERTGEDADDLANRLFLEACESEEAKASFARFSR